MVEQAPPADFFDSYALRKVLPGYVGHFIRLSIGREYKVGVLDKIEYGWAYIQVPSSKPEERPRLAMVKLSRISAVELWER